MKDTRPLDNTELIWEISGNFDGYLLKNGQNLTSGEFIKRIGTN